MIRQTVSEHARPESHPAEAWSLPRWRPGQSRRFNLSDPLDNHYAFAKVQVNLVGAISWLGEYGVILLCPPGEPAYPILGRLSLAKVFATPADPALVAGADAHSFVMWGTMTTTYVDPRTFKPVSRVLNPYTGRMFDAQTIHYADRLVFRPGKVIMVPGVDTAFYDQPWDRDGHYSQHHVDTGSETSYSVLGSSQQPGAHQPRVDASFWTAKTSELLDPRFETLDARRNLSAVMKVSEYPWYGVEKGDPAQLLMISTGIKTEDPGRLSPLVRRLVLERFEQRFG